MSEQCKENKFLKQWKDDVMESLCKYDSDSVEEVYQNGIRRGIDLMFKEICKANLITNDNNLITASLIADELKENANE